MLKTFYDIGKDVFTNTRALATIVYLTITLLLFGIIVKLFGLFPTFNNYINTNPDYGITNIIESEDPQPLKDNVAIYCDVVTLDKLEFSQNEINEITVMLKTNNIDTSLDIIKYNLDKLRRGSGFNLDLNDKKLPKESKSFERFKGIYDTKALHDNFSSQERKSIYLSPEYWKLLEKSKIDINVFPKLKQYSVVIVTITGINEKCNGIVYNGFDKQNEIFSIAVNNLTDANYSDARYVNGSLYACMIVGERLIFNSNNYSWSIFIDEVFNVPKMRGDNDMCIIKWSTSKLK